MIKKMEQVFRQFFPKRMKNHQFFLSHLKGLNGLEIGGPSPSFDSRGFIPLYECINNLDGCNFSDNTVWEGNIGTGQNYKFGKKTGYQIISDGSDLSQVPDAKYEFVLSCHSIEHFANPIKALLEWKRVIRDNGYILLVVPHKDKTFDNRRPVTTLEHIVEDHKNNVQEDDSTHFEEVISLHDILVDNGIADKESLRKRTLDNFNNRCVHHHVFNTPLVAKIANHIQLKICDIQHFNPFNIIILLQKCESETPNNSSFLDGNNKIYQNNLFPSDKNG